MSDQNPYEGKGTAGEGRQTKASDPDAIVKMAEAAAASSVEYDAGYGRTSYDAALADADRNAAAFEAAQAVGTPERATVESETPEEAATTLSEATERYADGAGPDAEQDSDVENPDVAPADAVTNGDVEPTPDVSPADATVAEGEGDAEDENPAPSSYTDEDAWSYAALKDEVKTRREAAGDDYDGPALNASRDDLVEYLTKADKA